MFDVEIAQEVGIMAAVLFQNIAFWCMHSRANGNNFHDGRYWTYNTNRAFCELFPYMTSKIIRTSLQKLIDADMIVTGNYNERPYDRTIWYALSEKGKCIFLRGQKDLPYRANGIAPEGEPIPDINTDIRADINTDNISSPDGDGARSRFDDFWDVYPHKVKKQDAQKAWKRSKADKVADIIIADVEKRCRTEWKGQDIHYVPHPTTYLNQRRWEDDTQPTERKDRVERQQPVNPSLDYDQRKTDESYYDHVFDNFYGSGDGG